MLAARPRRTRMIARPRTGPGTRLGEVIPYDYGAVLPDHRPARKRRSERDQHRAGQRVRRCRGRIRLRGRSRPSVELCPHPTVGTVLPGSMRLGELPPSALIEGFRINPRSEHLVFRQDDPSDFTDDDLPEAVLNNGTLFQRVRAPAEISFLFSILDSGTGRELQDEPVHNVASLGKSNGERPFKLLAQPITFLPRSTIRLQIVERSQGVQGNLFVVFYGYQIVGSSGCPELVARRLTGSPVCPTETIGSPSARVIPFDYVATFNLTGRPQNQVESEVTVNAEGGFVATSIGYGLLVEEREAPIQRELTSGSFGTFNLATVTLRSFPANALMDGIRIRPDLVRLAFKDNGQLAEQVPNEPGRRIVREAQPPRGRVVSIHDPRQRSRSRIAESTAAQHCRPRHRGWRPAI